MNPDALLSEGPFELAHALPSRVRLRWRGEGEPPQELLLKLAGVPGVLRVDYRPASRSVLVYGGSGVVRRKLPGARRLSPGEARVGGDRAAVLAANPEREPDTPRQPVDLDAVLTMGLVATWLADLIASRAIRLLTLPLLVLAGVTGYRLYERRQRAGDSDVDDTSDLMLLVG